MDKPGSMRAIADAIVGQQPPHKSTSDKTDLKAMEAALLAEIEAFDRQAAPPASPAAPCRTAGGREEANPFPTIIPEGVVRIAPPGTAAVPTPAASPASTPTRGASLLDQLRQQAQARQSDDSTRQQDQAALAHQLDGALRRIFSYCNDLVQQLNILHPAVERPYTLPGNVAISNLEWGQGFADYRTRPDSAGTLYELVTLSCQLAGPTQLRVEREGPSADIFRRALFEHGVVFTHDEVKNARQMVEKVIFTIRAEVKISLRWCADLERRNLVLESRNLERFGGLRYVIAPESVTPAMLDELVRLLLGQPNRFREYCSKLTA